MALLKENIKTILIADDDLGFVVYLGLTLADAGYQTVPARNAAEAFSLLSELKLGVDLLIADFASAGVGGRELVNRLRGEHKPVRIIAIVDATEGAPPEIAPGVRPDATLRRVSQDEPLPLGEWLGTVLAVLQASQVRTAE